MRRRRASGARQPCRSSLCLNWGASGGCFRRVPPGPVDPMTAPAKPPRKSTTDEAAELKERAWRMRVENGLSTSDIAAVLGRERTTVGRMLRAVRRQLAALYRPGGRFDPAEVVAV